MLEVSDISAAMFGISDHSIGNRWGAYGTGFSLKSYEALDTDNTVDSGAIFRMDIESL